MSYKKKIQAGLELLAMIMLTAVLIETCNLKREVREYKNIVLKLNEKSSR